MRTWQRAMIALARSRGVTRAMHRSRLMRRLSRQFVGGASAAEAVQRAGRLRDEGLASSLFFLGEYEDSAERVEQTVQQLLAAAAAMAAANLDVHISVDPTQVGSLISWQHCRENLTRLGEAVRRAGSGRRKTLMLDMEDSGVTEQTLEAFEALRSKDLPVALVIQAYLRRSKDDVTRLAQSGAMVRLVKGAFAEEARVAFTRRSEIDESYLALAEILLSRDSRARGVYPVFGTHDARMISQAARTADANGWRPDEWEIEMLLGVRPDLQRELVAAGRAVRLYLPFGESWWPYSIRRVGENARNLAFVLRAIRG
jgi:proline dehydrogenase